MQRTNRYVALDGLRGIAAICVMIHHYTQHSSLVVFRFAEISVDLLFCVSGFIVASVYWQKIDEGMKFSEFFGKRLIRLYPLFLIGTTIGAVVFSGHMIDGSSDVSWVEFATALTLNHVYLPFPNHHFQAIDADKIPGATFLFNNPSWSLCFELSVNAAFFLLFFSKHATRKSLLVIVAMSYAALILAACFGKARLGWGTGIWQYMSGMTRASFGFFSGVLVQGQRRRLDCRLKNPVFTILYMASFMVLCLMPPSNIAYLAIVAGLPLFVIVGSLITPEKKTKLTCEWLGAMSYPIYCLHMPVYMLLNGSAWFRDQPPVVKCVVGLAIVIPSCRVLLRFYDLPMRTLLSGKLSPREQLRDLSLGTAYSTLS